MGRYGVETCQRELRLRHPGGSSQAETVEGFARDDEGRGQACDCQRDRDLHQTEPAPPGVRSTRSVLLHGVLPSLNERGDAFRKHRPPYQRRINGQQSLASRICPTAPEAFADEELTHHVFGEDACFAVIL